MISISISQMTNAVMHLFMCFIDHFCVFFGEMSIKIFRPFILDYLFLLSSCNSSLYILDPRPLSDSQIFSLIL